MDSKNYPSPEPGPKGPLSRIWTGIREVIGGFRNQLGMLAEADALVDRVLTPDAVKELLKELRKDDKEDPVHPTARNAWAQREASMERINGLLEIYCPEFTGNEQATRVARLRLLRAAHLIPSIG